MSFRKSIPTTKSTYDSLENNRINDELDITKLMTPSALPMIDKNLKVLTEETLKEQ